MKRIIAYISLILIMVSCGPDGDHFKITGKLKNMNQGEFFIYSPDGGMSKLDTIKVMRGEFVYETKLDRKATFVIVFPNFSEQAVFGEPGTAAEMEGDVSHLKEMTVKGNDDNKLMTAFRQKVMQMSDKEIKKEIKDFVDRNPESIVGIYLVNKYFIRAEEPDYKTALSLLDKMAKKQPENGYLTNLRSALEGLSYSDRLPSFSAISVKGDRVSNSTLNSELNVITLWATWNFESMAAQRIWKEKKRQYGSKLSLLSINVDPSRKQCKEQITRDSIGWSNVCDGMMWDSKIVKILGFSKLPGNIIADKNGKILKRNVETNAIDKELKDRLQKK